MSKFLNFPLGISAVAGALVAASIAAPASAGLIGSLKINGVSYNVGTGATLTDMSGPAYNSLTDDYITISTFSTSITVDIYATDKGFYWDPTGGYDFTVSLTDLDWSGPAGSYISGVTMAMSGDAAVEFGYSAALTSPTAITLGLDGDIYDYCSTTYCGTMTVTILGYEPPPPPPPPPAYVPPAPPSYDPPAPPSYDPPSGPANGPGDTYSIPEPATLAVFGLGLAGIGFLRRRKRA